MVEYGVRNEASKKSGVQMLPSELIAAFGAARAQLGGRQQQAKEGRPRSARLRTANTSCSCRTPGFTGYSDIHITMRGSLVTSFGRLAVSSSAPLASSSRTVLVGAAAAAVKGAQNLQPQRRVQAGNVPSSSCRGYATEAAASSPYSLGRLIPAQPKKKAKRLGRGDSSGRGGTSTRGHKGQKARRGNGKPTPGFEGGQTPIMRRFPKRGFVNA